MKLTQPTRKELEQAKIMLEKKLKHGGDINLANAQEQLTLLAKISVLNTVLSADFLEV